MEESNADNNNNNNEINTNNIKTKIDISCADTNNNNNNVITTNTSTKPHQRILNQIQPTSSPIITNNNQTINRNTTSTYNELLFYPSSDDKLHSIQNNLNTKHALIHENTLLKKQLLKLQNILNEKLIIITDFQHTFETSNLKFKQLVNKIELLNTQKSNLSTQLTDYQTQLYKQKLKINELESHSKSMVHYEEHISSLQNDFTKTETQLTLKHKEKETELRNEYNNELAKLHQQIEELKQQNEKYKHEISNHKLTIESYVNQNEINESHLNEKLQMHQHEIKNKDDIINTYEKRITHNEKVIQEHKQTYETEINKIKHEKEMLMNELNNNKQSNLDMQKKLNELTLQYDITLKQYKECKINLENKENVVNQLKQQIEFMNKELISKEKQIEMNDTNKIKDNKEYELQLKKVIKDKQTIEQVNMELNGCLNKANSKIKELNDIINSHQQQQQQQCQCSCHDNKQYIEELVCKLKQRETSLIEENAKLKEILSNNVNGSNSNSSKNQCDNDKTYQIHSCHSAVNNRRNYNLDYSHYNNVNENNNMTRRRNVYNDIQEEEQRKTLEDFRRLLNNIDEKFDLPEIIERNYY